MSNSARCYQLSLFLRTARSFLPDFNQNLNFFSAGFSKSPKSKLHQNPFSAIRRVERHTEIHDETKGCFLQIYESS